MKKIINASLDSNSLAITGRWTILIDHQKAKEIFGANYPHSVNNGLFTIDGNNICLSHLPESTAKITLSNDDLAEIRSVLKI